MPTKMYLEAFDSLSLIIPSIANFIGMGPLQLHKVLNREGPCGSYSAITILKLLMTQAPILIVFLGKLDPKMSWS